MLAEQPSLQQLVEAVVPAVVDAMSGPFATVNKHVWQAQKMNTTTMVSCTQKMMKLNTNLAPQSGKFFAALLLSKRSYVY